MAEALFPASYDLGGMSGINGSLAASLIAELQELRLALDSKSAKLKELESHTSKLEAAVEHRDAVIAQLASSRKLVFEECHRACVSNQAELRQMQDALHRVSRQLQRERREHAARLKEARRAAASVAGATRGPLTPKDSPTASALPWDDSEGSLSDDDHTGLCLDEGVDDVAPGTPPTRYLYGAPAPAHASTSTSPPSYSQAEEVDFLTW